MTRELYDGWLQHNHRFVVTLNRISDAHLHRFAGLAIGFANRQKVKIGSNESFLVGCTAFPEELE